MASTYTANLRVTLQATGENANTWGTIANQQTIQLLEDAITSFTSISTTGGSTTLSSNSGSSDQARSAFLQIGGVLVCAANIVIPNVPKFYGVQNQTSGGFTVTLKSTSGSGVAIPQDGNFYWAVHDGNNGTFIVTGNTSVSAAEPTTKFTLPIAF